MWDEVRCLRMVCSVRCVLQELSNVYVSWTSPGNKLPHDVSIPPSSHSSAFSPRLATLSYILHFSIPRPLRYETLYLIYLSPSWKHAQYHPPQTPFSPTTLQPNPPYTKPQLDYLFTFLRLHLPPSRNPPIPSEDPDPDSRLRLSATPNPFLSVSLFHLSRSHLPNT